ncbi:MAG: hypothetical protein Q4C47_09215 [Planctomycetia bacterium]|nr:hypothetical protein [Planctomycetia bacterium]
MRICGLGILAASLFACAGCSICCTPYDECGPTSMSGLCNTRAGSVISYSGPQGSTTSRQGWTPQRSDAAPIPSAQPTPATGTTTSWNASQPVWAQTATAQPTYTQPSYSPAGYAASVPTSQATQEVVYAWTSPPSQPLTISPAPQNVGGQYTGGYEPVSQPQMAAIPEELRQRYPAGSSASF